MKRTPLRRTGRIRAKPRPAADRVTPDLHRLVVQRDGMCFGALAVLAGAQRAGWTVGLPPVDWHECRDRMGNAHAATALDRLEVDHFWHHAGGTKGDRAPSRPENLVAMCGWLNNRPPPAVIREYERAYARWRYP